jgi:hypothetical protein
MNNKGMFIVPAEQFYRRKQHLVIASRRIGLYIDGFIYFTGMSPIAVKGSYNKALLTG